MTGNGPASMISGQLVSGDFFQTLGLKAAAGRVLELSDDSPTAAPVAVLNYGYWQSSFGGARDAVGRTIELNGTAFTIVGVVEQRFTGITPGSDFDVWLPLAAGARISNPRMWDNREDKVTWWWLTILGRLKAEKPMLQAQATISGMFRNECCTDPYRCLRWAEERRVLQDHEAEEVRRRDKWLWAAHRLPERGLCLLHRVVVCKAL